MVILSTIIIVLQSCLFYLPMTTLVVVFNELRSTFVQKRRDFSSLTLVVRLQHDVPLLSSLKFVLSVSYTTNYILIEDYFKSKREDFSTFQGLLQVESLLSCDIFQFSICLLDCLWAFMEYGKKIRKLKKNYTNLTINTDKAK